MSSVGSNISSFIRNKKKLLIGILVILAISALYENILSPDASLQERYIKNSSQNRSQQETNGPIVWQADHETGDATQWMSRKSEQTWQDSGLCIRPKNGVVSDVSHRGEYALKMTIGSWFPHSGCRQFRYPEARSGEDYYYSAWLYFPEQYEVNGWTNIMQFKAKKNSQIGGPSAVFWSVRLMSRENGEQYFQLSWKGGEGAVTGPTAEDNITSKQFTSSPLNVPVKEWVHLEMFLKQSSDFDGHIIVWQDGQEIYNIPGVRTKFEDSYNSWSVNSYGAGISPSTFTVYVDDAAISTERLGPSYFK